MVEHGCFFVTALMLLVPGYPTVAERREWPRWAMLPYLILADGRNTILAALFMFSDRVIYPYYATIPRVAGSRRLAIKSSRARSCFCRLAFLPWCRAR